jgi:hypothetical protein
MWVVNSSGNIFRRDNGKWVSVSGSSAHISVGSKNHVASVDSSGKISLWDGSKWTEIDGGATKVAIGSDGDLWCLNKEGSFPFFYFFPLSSFCFPFSLAFFSLVLLCLHFLLSGNIWHRVNGKWTKVEGAATDITVNDSTTVFCTNSNGDIWQLVSGSWKKVEGKCTKLDAGLGCLVCTNSSGNMYVAEFSLTKTLLSLANSIFS